MDLTPIIISLKTASVSIVFTFIIGTWLAYVVFTMKNDKLKSVIDAVLTLPLVLPPTVAGFFLLYIFGLYRPVGSFLADMGIKLVFNWPATVLAAFVISLPLMYRSAKAAFAQVDAMYIQAAKTLGLSRVKIIFRVFLPLALPGLASGGILAFSRGLGEFGATAMIAGNIAGSTRTMPMAIYSSVTGGHMEEAYDYVVILLIISFLLIFVMDFVTEKKSRAYREKEFR